MVPYHGDNALSLYAVALTGGQPTQPQAEAGLGQFLPAQRQPQLVFRGPADVAGATEMTKLYHVAAAIADYFTANGDPASLRSLVDQMAAFVGDRKVDYGPWRPLVLQSAVDNAFRPITQLVLENPDHDCVAVWSRASLARDASGEIIGGEIREISSEQWREESVAGDAFTV